MPDVPWSGGPPSTSELENWLVNVKGFSREDAREVGGMYAAQQARGWTQESLDVWLTEMVTATDSADADDGDQPYAAVRDQAAQIAAEQEARSNARRVRGSALANQRSQIIHDQVQGYYDQANQMAASIANSNAIGMRVDEGGNPILDEEGNPVEMTTADLWNEIKGLSFNMVGLNLPYSYSTDNLVRSRIPQRVNDASARRWSRDRSARFEGAPTSGLSQRSANAYSARMSGQARRLGKGGPGKRARFRGGLADSRMTPSHVLALLGNMNEDELTRIQQQLVDAGMYGAGEEFQPPSWGTADTATRRAFMNLFMIAAERDPGAPISRILADLTAESVNRQGPPESGPGAPGQQELVPIPDFTPTVMSKETLGATIDDIAQDLFGEFVPQDRKEALIARLQEREVGIQRQEYDLSVANIREQASAQFAMGQMGGGGQGGAAPGGGEIDRFKAAISGRESGGDYSITNRSSGASGRYQIMPANWGPWATRAGLGPNAPMTPENQETVATRIMLDYYQQFGNWRDVAIAWFAGPGAVGRPGAENRSDGNMTVREYANDIMNRMGASGASDPSTQSGLVEIGGRQMAPVETFDPQSEAAAILKAQDPAGWEAHEFANRALDFYSLLGGVAGGS